MTDHEPVDGTSAGPGGADGTETRAPGALDRLSDPVAITRRFMLVTIVGSLVAWEIGFELGAFDTVSYRRVFAVFVVSTVVLVSTMLANDDTFATSNIARAILALPLLYLLADVSFLTSWEAVDRALQLLILVTFPFTLYVIARLVDNDFYRLPRREQLLSALVVVVIGAAGAYVGVEHPRFLTCQDFERLGDYQPENCFDSDAD